jgi:hypothetical protein
MPKTKSTETFLILHVIACVMEQAIDTSQYSQNGMYGKRPDSTKTETVKC